ncbi:hypothetical protein OV320_2612 [Actinobacteria bacterium OV320]|jgi:hypothetical protein|nr:hypothetical protein OV320_2612 [Actinobacteria bacterium OV320]
MPETTPGYSAALGAAEHHATTQNLRDQAYTTQLARQLYQRYPDLLTAETDLAILRARLAIVTTFIQNPIYDATTRHALAQALNLPTPEKT